MLVKHTVQRKNLVGLIWRLVARHAIVWEKFGESSTTGSQVSHV